MVKHECKACGTFYEYRAQLKDHDCPAQSSLEEFTDAQSA